MRSSYMALTEGLSTAGWVAAGLVVGSVGAPLVIKGLNETKKELRGLAVGMVRVTLSAGHYFENCAKRQGDWWNNVVEEARIRHENKKAGLNLNTEGKTMAKEKMQVEEHGHTFVFKEHTLPGNYN